MLLIQVSTFLAGLCCIGLAKITVQDFDGEVVLQECVEEIVHSYFNLSDVVWYLNFDQKYQNLDFKSLPAIKINNLEALKTFEHLKPNWYIITGNLTIVANKLWNLMNTDNWNAKARFVIIYEGNVQVLYYWLERFYILDVVVLSERGGTIDISTYFPYDSEKSNKAIVKGNCTNVNLIRYLDLFPTKLPKHWENTTINVILNYRPPYIDVENNKQTGIEINIMELVRSKIGFQINMIWDFQVSKCSAGTCYFDPIKELQYKIGIYLVISSKIPGHQEDSIPFLYDSLQWVVPVADLEITWYRLANIFHYSLWLSLMAVVIIAPFIFYFMAVQERDVVNYRRFPECFIMTVQCLIGHPVNIIPRSNSVRILLAAFLMFCCVIVTAYQSRLLWDYYDDSKQISTVKEILESNLKVGFPVGFDTYFSDKDNHIGSRILNIRQECDSLACLNRTVKERDFVTFDVKRTMLHLNNEYFLGKNNESHMYFLEDGLIQCPITMKFIKGFPLTDNINKVLHELQEHGITQYLSEKFDFAAERPIERALEIQYSPHRMNLEKLQGAFWILFLGWSLSFVALVCEILYSRYRRS